MSFLEAEFRDRNVEKERSTTSSPLSHLQRFTEYGEFLENRLSLRRPHRVASGAICLLSFFTSYEYSGFVPRGHCSSLFFVHGPASTFVTSLYKFISLSSLQTNPPEQERQIHAPPGTIYEACHRERPKLAAVQLTQQSRGLTVLISML